MRKELSLWHNLWFSNPYIFANVRSFLNKSQPYSRSLELQRFFIEIFYLDISGNKFWYINISFSKMWNVLNKWIFKEYFQLKGLLTIISSVSWSIFKGTRSFVLWMGWMRYPLFSRWKRIIFISDFTVKKWLGGLCCMTQ